ncbi:uncharacterized protein LOC120279459 [Dioscorea cayenensis subsp. rotundata]|uniref:Uncharacterized protein LOC120279459 n=1 Tax=Dioscorea cayennensis subsp. rotundata TaxID=55577 RepID=A0AB40CQM4_DIOCR|nr:uncharacterized protein LOC120279459 [Dioscorea cayenensis subsp. rotundata]
MMDPEGTSGPRSVRPLPMIGPFLVNPELGDSLSFKGVGGPSIKNPELGVPLKVNGGVGLKSMDNSVRPDVIGPGLNESVMEERILISDDQDSSFCNPSKPPSAFTPPPNFKWVFLHGIWTLVPSKFSADIIARSAIDPGSDQLDKLESWGDDHQDDDLQDNEITEVKESEQETYSTDSRHTEDSETDFEEKVRRLLHSG